MIQVAKGDNRMTARITRSLKEFVPVDTENYI